MTRCILLLLLFPSLLGAQIVNFDCANTSVSPYWIGADDYLALNGMTLSAVTPGTRVVIMNDLGYYGGAAVRASSPPNTLTQIGSNEPVSFTIAFSTSLQSLAFERAGLVAGPNGITHPAWSATALTAAGVAIGPPVGEGRISSFADVPAAPFTLNGPGIAAVRFDSQNQQSAFSAVVLDDFVLTPAAAPSPLKILPPTAGDGSVAPGRRVPAGPPETKTIFVRAATGATVTLAGGRARVKFPARSLQADQTVTVTYTDTAPAAPPNRAFVAAGPSVTLLFEMPSPLASAVTVEVVADQIDAMNGVPFAYVQNVSCADCFVVVGGSVSAATNRATLVIEPAVANASADVVAAGAQRPETVLGTRIAASFFNLLGDCPQYAAGWKVWTGVGFETVASSYTQLPPGISKDKKTLVLVHGMAGSIEESFHCRGELPASESTQIVGLDYDWTRPLDESGRDLAALLNVLYSHGVTDLDIEAHSEGVPVALSALGQASCVNVGNVFLLGGPINGTPIAAVPNAVLTFVSMLPGCFAASAPAIRDGAFRGDLLPDSAALKTIRDQFNARPQHPSVWTVAGTHEFFPYEKFVLRMLTVAMNECYDGVIPVPSALGRDLNVANLCELGEFPVTHIALECDPAVNGALTNPRCTDVRRVCGK